MGQRFAIQRDVVIVKQLGKWDAVLRDVVFDCQPFFRSAEKKVQGHAEQVSNGYKM